MINNKKIDETGGKPIAIGSERQLFIDGRFIENGKNISLVVHKPQKTGETNIIMENSSHCRIGGYNSVMYEDGEYKMWYVENTYKKEGIFIYVRYARSDDGINWEKPKFYFANQYHEKRNNIVLGFGAGGVKGGLGDGTCMVFIDPNDNQEKKYKMVARHGLHKPLGLYSSPDGIRWKPDMETILDDGRFTTGAGIFHLDSQNVIFWDDRIGKYVAYVRKNFEKHGQFRTVARGESGNLADFPHVNDMNTVMQTDAGDVQVNTEHGRLPAADFYTNATLKYPWAQDAYFMFPNIYFKYDAFLPEFAEDKPRNAGPIDIRFASSRDGISWNRHDKSAFVGLGAKNDFDAYSLYMLNGIVPGKGNEMYMYYMGTDMMHGWDRGDRYEERENRILTATGFDSKRRVSAISRLVIRRDGFISVKGSYNGGEFMTPLIVFDGEELKLNIDTSATGMVKVGIMDESGEYIKGFSPGGCDIIHTANELNKTVKWRGNSDVGMLSGKAVKLHFELSDTDLYAFQFMEKEENPDSPDLSRTLLANIEKSFKSDAYVKRPGQV